MRYELKYIIPLAAAVFLSAGGHAFGQSIKAGTKYCIDKFGQSEYSLILKDISGETKTKLAGDAELRKKQVETLREMFAFGCEAEKRGIVREETNAAELENIRSETVAASYDQYLNKGKALPMFSGITDAQVAEFYKVPANTVAFQKFIKSKVALLHRADPSSPDREIADDEKEQAKNFYAKIKISENESVRNAASLDADFKRSTELKVLLQQSQFLARTLSERIAAETAVNGDEVSNYIAGHPEFDTSAKKAEAAKILVRAKAGEDFAALADQYSQDPGNIGENGKKNGGSYSNVPKGRMIRPFENAALSLQPGGIYPDLVESDFGYHIIKLERKTGTGDDLKYDVRHILISTTVKDPANPNGRELPIKEYVRTKLESEKESALVAKIVADNPIAMDDLQIEQPVAAKPVVTKPTAKRPVARKTAVRRRR